jgi:CubicO group peptidase (beta-lactamase class C family)
MLKRIEFFFCVIIALTSSLVSKEIKPVDEKLVQSLIGKFVENDPFENQKAIAELSRVGEMAVGSLIAALQDGSENVRWCSAITLEKIAPLGKRAIPDLRRALHDKSANVRWCSVLALGKFGGEAESAAAELQQLLHDEDHDVRWAAYIALSKIDKGAIQIAPDFSQVINKVEELTLQLMKDLKVPGVSISIIRNNTIEWSKSYGFSDAVQRTKVDATTIFEACSMSKPVFAFLALKLADQGKLDLDKPLGNSLPEDFVCETDDYAKQITARMVLAHTSGMPNWRKGGEERLAPLPVYFRPGTKFSYSGEGFYYLQRVVERITKEPLEVYSKRILFDKLGLSSTSYVWAENAAQQYAAGHDTSGNCLVRSKYRHANAAYTLYTTPDEYAKLLIAILHPNDKKEYSLSGKMQREMLTHQVRVDTRDVIDRPGRHLGLIAYRGLGWAIDSTITHDIVYHSGANQTGFRCYAQYNQNDGTGLVIMTNGMNGSELWSRLISAIGDY